MKLANLFTTLRILLAPVFFILYFLPQWVGTGSALSVFILIPLFAFMEFTDFLDGYYARKLREVSDFGKIYDPFADVLANMTVLFSFVLSGYLPSILFLIILYREMGILFVRMLAAREGVAIAARKGGKAKTVLYILAAGFSLAIESGLRLGLLPESILPLLTTVNYVLYGLAVILSLLSFADYLVNFSSVLKIGANSRKKQKTP